MRKVKGVARVSAIFLYLAIDLDLMQPGGAQRGLVPFGRMIWFDEARIAKRLEFCGQMASERARRDCTCHAQVTLEGAIAFGGVCLRS